MIREGATLVILGVLLVLLTLVLGCVIPEPLAQLGAPGFEPPIVHWMTLGRNVNIRLLVSRLAILPLRYSVNHARFLFASHVTLVAFASDVGMLRSANVAVEFLMIEIRFEGSFTLVKIASCLASRV